MNFLSNKSHVRIVCTARSARETDLKPAIEFLNSLGLQVSLGKSIDVVHDQMGGDKYLRAQDFLDAYLDQTIDIIWIARGGYGTIQLIDELDENGISLTQKDTHKKPKVIIGYSDVTYLHARLHKLGNYGIHSFMPLEFLEKPFAALHSLQTILSGVLHEIVISNEQNLKTQKITAPIFGGNLSILCNLLGSDDFPETNDTILFLEDIDEYLYHIERMMFTLKRAGKLKNLKALIVGGMTDMNDHNIPFGKNIFEIITNITSSYNYPVIFNFPAGHVADHRGIILGANMNISISVNHIKFTQQYGTT